MILTENKLKELTLAADVLSEAHRQTRFFSTGQQASVFLSHKHDEISQLKRVAYILAYIIHSGFISGYQNRYGDNLKPPTNVYHRMTA